MARPGSAGSLASRGRWPLAVYVACFTMGALTHARDVAAFGWRPYRWAPPLLECFWTALLPLDLAVVALLLAGRRRTGLTLAAGVMVLDVAANGYALLVLAIPVFTVPLVLQATFLGFVLGSMGFLWPARRAER